jgi:tRNA threonylcarbamoyladenosine biosynthesis protein TsaB
VSDDARYILAFDTALMGCAAALYDAAEGRAWTRREPMARGQSERLVPMVQEVIRDAGREFSDIDLIVTTTGPGAFTGLRLALSAARAWGLSLDRPVAGVTTLAVLAGMFYDTGETAPIRILIETKRNDFYTQLWRRDGVAGAAESLSLDAIQAQGDATDIVYIGDAASRFMQESGETGRAARAGYELADPAMIARLGLHEYRMGRVKDMPAPLYLRGADVSQSKRAQRHIADE